MYPTRRWILHISRLVSPVTAAALLLIVAPGVGATTPVRSPISPPGATYPWVEPFWVTVHGVTLAKAPTRVADVTGQFEPSWVNAKGITPPTAASLPGATYPWVEPYWVTVHGVTLAKAPTVAGGTGNADVEPIWLKVDGLTLPTLPY